MEKEVIGGEGVKGRCAGNVKVGATALCRRARSASTRPDRSRVVATGDEGDGGRGTSLAAGDIVRSGR